jgi:serine/threonine protein phosphatase PrpC
VWLQALQAPGLNMSRSLCDGLAKGGGVTSAPHGSVARLTRAHRALVLCSDGVWDFVTPGEAGTLALSTPHTADAAGRLARLARSRWLHRTAGADDTTALVVRLVPPPEPR